MSRVRLNLGAWPQFRGPAKFGGVATIWGGAMLPGPSVEPAQSNTWGDSDVISMPAGFRRRLVGKTLINVFHCDSAEIRFVGELLIIQRYDNGMVTVF